MKNISSKVKLWNGVEMPVLGLGVYKAKDGQEVINAIHDAFEAGYRLIDTASFYHNEAGVGEAVRTAGFPREEVFVTTKVWNDDQGYEETLKAFEKSLSELGLEYLDLYLIHWPVPGKYLDTWKALEQLYKEGKVKAIGVSNCLKHHLQDIFEHADIKPMLVQNEFHPRLVQQELIDFCKENKIQYEGWSPLMRGQILKNNVVKRIAEKHKKTVAQVVLRWHLQKGVVAIPKSVHKERIQENADIFDFELSAKEMAEIDGLDREERTGAHPDDFMEHFNGN